MPDDGWSEPWPPRDDDEHEVWQRFIDQLNPAELEQERMRAPERLDDERFGGRAHARMVAEHEARADQLRRDRDELDEAIRRTGLPPERAALRVLAERDENQNTHTRGNAA